MCVGFCAVVVEPAAVTGEEEEAVPMSVSNSNLSAEAESFVPSTTYSQDSTPEAGALPRYVTSCYPFVQEDGNGNAPHQPHQGYVQYASRATNYYFLKT